MNSPNRNLAIITYVLKQGNTVAAAARHFKVSRQWVYTLIHRYETSGGAGLQPRTKAPHTPTPMKNRAPEKTKSTKQEESHDATQASSTT
ncbi:helix-turn-helix domain-containing protein [Corynebacterium felinum]|uniref:helix-turn-helix domain-containing protein n=1 Tax=Corynebacterium felinum TaxID=131318 RepID=UPI0033901B76